MSQNFNERIRVTKSASFGNESHRTPVDTHFPFGSAWQDFSDDRGGFNPKRPERFERCIASGNDQFAEVRAYAWSSPIEGSDKRRFFAVLHVPPITLPVEAVRAAIVAEQKAQG